MSKDELTDPESYRRGGSAVDPHARRTITKIYELLIVFPILAWFAFEIHTDPHQFLDARLIVWIAAITVVDLLPVPTAVQLRFSLSFPLQLAVARRILRLVTPGARYVDVSVPERPVALE